MWIEATPTSPLRLFARACLTILLVGSCLLALWNVWSVATSWPGSALVQRGQAEIRTAIDRSLARNASPTVVVARHSTLLAEDQRNWLAIEAVEAIAAERAIILPTELLERRNTLHAQDSSFTSSSTRCLACAWDARECNFSAVLLCRAPVDLTPIGDLSAVVREGTNYARGLKVDMVALGLSGLGLASFALILPSGGSATTVAAGAGMGKTAWRMGRLSDGLITPLRRALSEGFDWARIGAVRSTDDLASLARPQALRPAIAFASDTGRIHRALGARQTLYLLSRADTPLEARRFANAAEAMGPRSVGALEVLGKSRFLRATLRWSDEIWWAITGMLGLTLAILGLFWNLAATLGLRLLRRWAR